MARPHVVITLKALRKAGYHADVCEKWVAAPQGKGQREKFKGGYRRDLFNLFDILAFDSCFTVAVQVTSAKGKSTHLLEYRRDPVKRQMILDWISDKYRSFELYLCSQPKGPKTRWLVESYTVTADDMVLKPSDVAAIAKAKAIEEMK